MLNPAPLLFLFLPLLVSAEFTFSGNSTLSSDNICSKTYARSLPCTPDLLSLIDDTTDDSVRFSRSLLEGSCTKECYEALAQWTSDIRRDCTANEEEVPDNRVFTMKEVLDPKVQWLETLWFDTCLTDLTVPGNQYCKTYNDTTKALDYLYSPKLMSTLNKTGAFCNSSCAVQTSIYLLETSPTKPNILDSRRICPDLDTKPFPFPESWKRKKSSGWQEGGEGVRGSKGPAAPLNGASAWQRGGKGEGSGTTETSTNSTGWQTGGESGRPAMNETSANSTGWQTGGEDGRGLNGSLVNGTLGDLPTSNIAAGTGVSLLAAAIVIGAMVMGFF